jgi:hypothetical protein
VRPRICDNCKIINEARALQDVIPKNQSIDQLKSENELLRILLGCQVIELRNMRLDVEDWKKKHDTKK